ncbi:MAG: glycosyltransferase [Kiritimatiellae bacterium]|nr:glycosyltransferase [Kiritimatiellia bacterium]
MDITETVAPLLTIVIPTRNEQHNIAACLTSVNATVAQGWCETLVIDNHSQDGTAEIAGQCGARVFLQGPERSAQRNRGWREAHGRYVLFLDADMRVPGETMEEIRRLLAGASPPDALYLREVRTGGGWWTRARNFERSFYDATCIDALRVIKRELLASVGGYDESMFAGEDWDLDRRVLALTGKVALTRGHLVHDEARLTFAGHLRKKRYYSGNFGAYLGKWGRDETTRRQFGPVYRFIVVFLEKGKWRRAMRHPMLLLTIWAERMLVGLLYLTRRRHAKDAPVQCRDHQPGGSQKL